MCQSLTLGESATTLRAESLPLEEVELPVACTGDFKTLYDKARSAEEMPLDLDAA
jgi:hypothetical protein